MNDHLVLLDLWDVIDLLLYTIFRLVRGRLSSLPWSTVSSLFSNVAGMLLLTTAKISTKDPTSTNLFRDRPWESHWMETCLNSFAHREEEASKSQTTATTIIMSFFSVAIASTSRLTLKRCFTTSRSVLQKQPLLPSGQSKFLLFFNGNESRAKLSILTERGLRGTAETPSPVDLVKRISRGAEKTLNVGSWEQLTDLWKKGTEAVKDIPIKDRR